MIASGANIINSILWDNVIIEENVSIKNSLIANNCEIGSNT